MWRLPANMHYMGYHTMHIPEWTVRRIGGCDPELWHSPNIEDLTGVPDLVGWVEDAIIAPHTHIPSSATVSTDV